MKKICIISGSRAEYGLLKNIMYKIKNDEDLILQLIIVGMHTSEKYGNTYQQIINDGFDIDVMIKMELDDDTSQNIVKESGKELIKFGDIYHNLTPNIIIVLGDRYEILIAVYAALIFKIPIAHICGGDLTENAYDDSIRHAITKMSHLHFTTHESSSARIYQMGESYVFCYGNPGLEDLHNFCTINKNILSKNLGIKFNKYNFLITFHPETLSNTIENDTNIVTNILEYYLKQNIYNIFIILPNSDNNNNIIFDKFINLNNQYVNCYIFKSLERYNYLSLAKYMDIFIGNSSSGIYEMPILKVPVINLGDRQKGRLLSNGILNTKINMHNIVNNINIMLKMEINDIVSIYKSYTSSTLIINKIKTFLNDMNHRTPIKKFIDK